MSTNFCVTMKVQEGNAYTQKRKSLIFAPKKCTFNFSILCLGICSLPLFEESIESLNQAYRTFDFSIVRLILSYV